MEFSANSIVEKQACDREYNLGKWTLISLIFVNNASSLIVKNL